MVTYTLIFQKNVKHMLICIDIRKIYLAKQSVCPEALENINVCKHHMWHKPLLKFVSKTEPKNNALSTKNWKSTHPEITHSQIMLLLAKWRPKHTSHHDSTTKWLQVKYKINSLMREQSQIFVSWPSQTALRGRNAPTLFKITDNTQATSPVTRKHGSS